MFDKGGETAFSLFGLFCVNINEGPSVRRLLESASEKLIVRIKCIHWAAELCARAREQFEMHPQARKIMGDNVTFMHGHHHKEFRRRVLPLFTDKALATYVELQARFCSGPSGPHHMMFSQDNIIREHLTDWNTKMAEAKDGLELRPLVWYFASRIPGPDRAARA